MNNNFKTIIPKSKEDFKKYYYLRWKILRKPYGEEMGTEIDQFENSAYHQMIINSKKKVIAIGRIHFLNGNHNDNIAQIRYMAVDNKYTKNWIDGLDVAVETKEILDWLTNESNK